MTLATTRQAAESLPTATQQARTRTILERAFFTKESVLKVMLNSQDECYFQWGWLTKEGWVWKKAKLNDVELGEILLVLEARQEKAAFFHSYDGREGKTTTQIWVNRSNGYCTFKVKECSKSLSAGEQRVLQTLLQHAIVLMSLTL